jgi:hypothetical protein
VVDDGSMDETEKLMGNSYLQRTIVFNITIAQPVVSERMLAGIMDLS